MRVRELLHKTDPYKHLEMKGFIPDITGWNSLHPWFGDLIREMRPQRICEVGTWKGASAINMAQHVEKTCPDVTEEIVCVDTWLGSLEFWEEPSRYDDLHLICGYPSVYYTFLRNVKHHQHDKLITPVPMTSVIAARWFKKNDIYFDLTYIDASHDGADVAEDVYQYSQISNVIMGDDYDWDSVRQAVDLIARSTGWTFVLNKEKWLFKIK